MSKWKCSDRRAVKNILGTVVQWGQYLCRKLLRVEVYNVVNQSHAFLIVPD